MCVNFIQKWRELWFKVDSERKIFEKLFMAILFTVRVFARNLLRGNHLTSNKPTHYLLDHGDFAHNAHTILRIFPISNLFSLLPRETMQSSVRLWASVDIGALTKELWIKVFSRVLQYFFTSSELFPQECATLFTPPNCGR